MIHLIALQIAADAWLDAVRQWWHLSDRQQKLSSRTAYRAIPSQYALLSDNAASPIALNLMQSGSRASRSPAREHSNPHSASSTA